MSKCKCDLCQKVYPAMQWAKANAPLSSGHYAALEEALMCNDQVREDCAFQLGKRDEEIARLRAELSAAKKLLKAKGALLVAYRIGKRPPKWALDACAKAEAAKEGKE